MPFPFCAQVKLYKSESLDNPIQTVSLGQSLFFHFPPLLRDGENYVVLLDSTLPRSQYDYVLPQVSFAAVGYHKHITLVFSPTVSKSGDIKQILDGGCGHSICSCPHHSPPRIPGHLPSSVHWHLLSGNLSCTSRTA